tara:strand:- start:117 stop:416 length:300 start_codon:yes stop_codon:yes gene_type:complete
MDYWLVIRVKPSYRPFVVNLPFGSVDAAMDAWSGSASGYGFNEALVVQAETHSEAAAEAQMEVRRMDQEAYAEYGFGKDTGEGHLDFDFRPLTRLRKVD